MDVAHVAGALVSALLHAGWNAAVKASPRPRDAMTGQMVMSAAIVVPGLLWTGLPAQASWIWIASSTALNLVTVTALLRAYELFGFGMTYPVVRAGRSSCGVAMGVWMRRLHHQRGGDGVDATRPRQLMARARGRCDDRHAGGPRLS